MHRTICIALAAAFAAAPAQADIRQGKPIDRPAPRHSAEHTGKGLSMREFFPGCAAVFAASRTKAMIPLIWLEKCADASRPDEPAPAESPPAGQQPKIAGPSIVRGPGACSVVGEVGRSC